MGSGGAAGAGFSLAATGFKMYGDYVTSRGTAAADVFKAEELERQAQEGELKAVQTNAQMTRNLAITLSHIDAVRSAAHTDPTSPTGTAVRGAEEEIGTTKKNIAVENIEDQVRTDEADAAYMRNAAGNALLAGDVSMLGDMFSGLSGAIGGAGGGPGGGSSPGGVATVYPNPNVPGGSAPGYS